MLKSFKPDWRGVARDPRKAVRAVLGVLLVANLAAAWFVFQPPGGSLEQLESEVRAARNQLVQRQQALGRAKLNLELAGKAREAGDTFLNKYFLARRTAYSTLLVDLGQAAKTAGIQAKERSFNYEPIEGSDTLGMLTINANFEGSYADLVQFVNQIDRSHRLMIIDSMTAQPQQQSNTLNINVKMNAFFRAEPGEAPVETQESE